MTLIRTLCACLLLTLVALADQVTFKNGDRLSGVIQKNDGKNLTLKSELAGVVSVRIGSACRDSAKLSLLRSLCVVWAT